MLLWRVILNANGTAENQRFRCSNISRVINDTLEISVLTDFKAISHQINAYGWATTAYIREVSAIAIAKNSSSAAVSIFK